MNKRTIGTAKEQKAASYLEEKGCQILQQNFRCRRGEIDLIYRDQGYLVFAEVKYRGSLQFGYPSDAVTYSKRQTISDVAAFYLYQMHIPQNMPVRFDVIAVSDQNVKVYKNAFCWCGRFRL